MKKMKKTNTNKNIENNSNLIIQRENKTKKNQKKYILINNFGGTWTGTHTHTQTDTHEIL